MRFVEACTFSGDQGVEVDLQLAGGEAAEAFRTVGDDAEFEVCRFEGAEGLVGVGPGLKFGVAGVEVEGERTGEGDGLGGVGYQVEVRAISACLVAEAEVSGAPPFAVLLIAGDGIPQRPAVEQGGEEVKQNSIVSWHIFNLNRSRFRSSHR